MDKVTQNLCEFSMDTKSIPIDTGPKSLVTIVRFHRFPAESEQVVHQYYFSGEIIALNQC